MFIGSVIIFWIIDHKFQFSQPQLKRRQETADLVVTLVVIGQYGNVYINKEGKTNRCSHLSTSQYSVVETIVESGMEITLF